MTDNTEAVEKLERLILGLAGKTWSWESIAKDILAAIQADPEAFGIVDPRIVVLEAALVHISGLSEHRGTDRMEAINNSALNYILHKALPRGGTQP